MAQDDGVNKYKELTDQLEAGIQDVFNSDKYRTYLSVMSRFHSYSFRNSLLIMLQRPEATHVAGFSAWRDKFHRSVKRGEKGIQILAPSPYRMSVEVEKPDETGKLRKEQVEIVKPAFRAAYVFDVDQTAGAPLPVLAEELSGTVSKYKVLFESIKSASPFPIEMEAISGGAKGYCDLTKRRIAVCSGMSEAQTFKTAIHEITHADLHAAPARFTLETKSRHTKEVEAESVAFVVCSHYGIDTSDYSFSYLASWSTGKELKELKASLETIQIQAGDLIDRIDKKYLELVKNQDLETANSLKFDMDIDLDREKTRPQRGFQEPKQAMSIAERMSAAKAKVAETQTKTPERSKERKSPKDREDR